MANDARFICNVLRSGGVGNLDFYAILKVFAIGKSIAGSNTVPEISTGSL